MRDKDDGPGDAVKGVLYERYLKPHLKRKPNNEHLNFLLDNAWAAFMLDVGTDSIRAMLFVEWMCVQLATSDAKATGSLVSCLFQEDFDSVGRVSRGEENLRASRGESEKWLVAAIDLYKVYFESEYRLWGTVPFCFVSRSFKLKTHYEDPTSVVHVAASEKFKAIKDRKIEIPQGNLSTLTEGFDSNIRNAGTGHDRWEITDKGTILLDVRSPYTGEQVGPERIEFSESQLNELLRQVRRTIWVLKMGVVIFSINNPDVCQLATRSKDVKIKEIELHLRRMTRDRCLELTSFDCPQDKSAIRLGLKTIRSEASIGGAVFASPRERFDLITVETTVSYSTQLLGVMQFLLVEFFEREKIPIVSVECVDADGKKIGAATYEPNELLKLLEKPPGIPTPKDGSLPNGEYSMLGDVRVPFGKRAEYMEKLKKSLAANMRIIG